MMNFIWASLLIISLVFGVFTQNTGNVAASVMDGASEAVELLLGILGILCFWSGMMEIANRAGITDGLSRIFSPVLKKLFRDVEPDSKAMRYISLNISANLLGLGNAATPFGLKAMAELQKQNPVKDTASDSMLIFVVMNTASLQLIPTTLCAYREQYSSESPFDILPMVWITSVAALLAGLTTAVLFCSKSNPKKLKGGSRVWT